jgi:NADPH2:quinone reductase
MKAIRLNGLGDPSNLEVVDVPVPVPAQGQILIKVEAAGIIFADVLIRRGSYVFKPPMPYVPGREVVGTVTEVGDGVGDFAVGDRVLGILMGGGYAEYAVATVDMNSAEGAPKISRSVVKSDREAGDKGPTLGRMVYPVGKDVAAGQAVSHGSNLRVAHLILHGCAKAEQGQSILLHAASGGVGAHLTRLAHDHGMKVFALAGSPEKAAYCKDNGADYVIEYKKADYVQAIRDITGGRGVDLSINSVSGDTLEKDAELLALGGQLVISGLAAGHGAIRPSAHGKSLTYKHFATYYHLGKPEDRAAMAVVTREIQAPSSADRLLEFSLTEASAAHAEIEAGRHFGKVILYP